MATDMQSERKTVNSRVDVPSPGESRRTIPQTTSPSRAWWVRPVAAIGVIAVIAVIAWRARRDLMQTAISRRLLGSGAVAIISTIMLTIADGKH